MLNTNNAKYKLSWHANKILVIIRQWTSVYIAVWFPIFVVVHL